MAKIKILEATVTYKVHCMNVEVPDNVLKQINDNYEFHNPDDERHGDAMKWLTGIIKEDYAIDKTYYVEEVETV
jgi:hypothetical protein